MDSESGDRRHNTLRQVQSYIKEYLNQEELKQRKIDATRIPNKHMQLRSNKNAYEWRNRVEKSNYFSKGLANKNFKLGYERTGRLEQN